MLDVAWRCFADELERFGLRVMDYSEEPLVGEYEVVVSTLSIHHLGGSEKKELFRRVYDVLSDGGALINADHILGSTPEIEAFYHEAWLRQVRERGASESDLAVARAYARG